MFTTFFCLKRLRRAGSSFNDHKRQNAPPTNIRPAEIVCQKSVILGMAAPGERGTTSVGAFCIRFAIQSGRLTGSHLNLVSNEDSRDPCLESCRKLATHRLPHRLHLSCLARPRGSIIWWWRGGGCRRTWAARRLRLRPAAGLPAARRRSADLSTATAAAAV